MVLVRQRVVWRCQRVALMFEIVGDIANVQVIATGRGIRRLETLRKRYGGSVGANSKEMLPFG